MTRNSHQWDERDQTRYWEHAFKVGIHNEMAVLEALGPPKTFEDFVRTQPSIVSRAYQDWQQKLCLCCHVRRANNSGTSYRPGYHAVPMTDAEHKRQHGQEGTIAEQGELGVFLSSGLIAPAQRTLEWAKVWFDRHAERIRQKWVQHELEAQFDRSLRDVSRDDLADWAAVCGYDCQIALERLGLIDPPEEWAAPENKLDDKTIFVAKATQGCATSKTEAAIQILKGMDT